MRNIVASILRDDYGLTVKTDGTGKGNMPLREAVKLIRGSDVAIEFHTNAAASKAATGIEALSTVKKQTLVSGVEQSCCQENRLETARRRRL